MQIHHIRLTVWYSFGLGLEGPVVCLSLRKSGLVKDGDNKIYLRNAKVWHELSKDLSLTHTLTRLCANGINHAFAFPAEAGPHSTESGGIKGWAGLSSLLYCLLREW